MTVTRRGCLMGVASLLASTSSPGAVRRGAGSLSRSVPDQIELICTRHIAKRLAAGLAIHVQRGSTWFAKGYGYENLETSSPATVETVFRIGSVSKQFCAASLLLLQQDRRLSLSDPLSKYFPRFPKAGEVTIRELLNHTSGIRNLTEGDGIIPCIDYGLEQMIEIISHQKPVYLFPPGTRWAYSNTAYTVAGAVLERVAGMPYWQFYTQRLFRPLGLRSIEVDRQADVVRNRASGYAFASTKLGFANAPYLSWTIPGPAGALRSTAADLARWHQALFRGRLLTAASLKEMTAPARLKNGRLASTDRAGPLLSPHAIQENGLGLELTQVDGRARVGHYGTIPGFAVDMGTFPAIGLTIVMLTNSDLSPDNPPRDIDSTVLGGLSP